MPCSSYTVSPDMDVRETGGWAQYPHNYPRKVYDHDLIPSADKEIQRAAKDEQRGDAKTEIRARQPNRQCRKEILLQQNFPGLARRRLHAEVISGIRHNTNPRREDLVRSRPSTCSGSLSLTLSQWGFSTGGRHRT